TCLHGELPLDESPKWKADIESARGSATASAERSVRYRSNGGTWPAGRRGGHEVRRIADAESGRLLHGRPCHASVGGTRDAGGPLRYRGTGVAPRGCAGDLLRDRLLSALSGRARAFVANRSRRAARLAVCIASPDVGENSTR